MSEKAFNPQEHLINLKGKNYLQVMHRLIWFRDRHPDGIIRTELIAHDPGQYAVFKATVVTQIARDGTDGEATGHGSETSKDFGDYLEKAETKAIGRALAALGFGTQFSAHEFGGEHENGRIVDSPVASQNGPGATAPPRDRSTTVNVIPDEAYPSGVTRKQVNMIGRTAEEKGVAPEQVKAMHGKESATLLTKAEASALIERLLALPTEEQGTLVDAVRADRYTS